MKKTTLLLLPLAIALIGASSAYAELPKGYVALKAGVYSPSTSHDIDNFNDGDRTHLDSKTGFNGEIAVGYYFIPMVALELGAGYFESKGSPAAQPGDAKLQVVPLTATGKVLLPLGIFEPYGLFGIGAYVTDLDVSHNSGTLSGSTEVTYGLHAGAGLNVNFSDSMFVGVEGKYLWAESSFGGEHIKLDGFQTTGVVGFRY
ncbi:MAG: outer membrane beta-barrel protein [Desulfuromonadaceae bacterium]|nr:outer membrane beta-barrel protein [Desulfuromonadaceae bacterium]MDD5107003.1 outer membrane beta-barrel protein [Desulfuromonadaceae bacterium]